MKLGYIGLGKMGKGMVFRLIEAGIDVVATDTSTEAIKEVEQKGAMGTSSLSALVQNLETPRTIWLMLPHSVVDTVLNELIPLLSPGDTIIDGGNSNFKETLRRAEELQKKNVNYMDVGVSGGPGGAREGACLMIGGKKEQFEKYKDLFKSIAAPDAYGHMGPVGAGHFVKMIHNGIEYGMMQAIGEGFEVMKKAPFDLDLTEIARVYNHQSVIESRLVGWLEKAYKEEGEDLSSISGKVSHSGEGLWTVETAKDLGVPVPIIEGSLTFREESQNNPSYTGQVVSALRNQFGGHEVKKDL